jgi:hypothetical protein
MIIAIHPFPIFSCSASLRPKQKVCGEAFFTADLVTIPFPYAKVVDPLFAAKSTFTLLAPKPKK